MKIWKYTSPHSHILSNLKKWQIKTPEIQEKLILELTGKGGKGIIMTLDSWYVSTKKKGGGTLILSKGFLQFLHLDQPS